MPRPKRDAPAEKFEDWRKKVQRCYDYLASEGEDYAEIKTALRQRFHWFSNQQIVDFMQAQEPLPTIPKHVYNSGTSEPFKLYFGRLAEKERPTHGYV